MKKLFFLLLIFTPTFMSFTCSKGNCDTCNAEPVLFPSVPPAGEFYATTIPAGWKSFTVNGVTYGFEGQLDWQRYCHNFNHGYDWAPGQLPKGFFITYHTDPSYYNQYGITDKVIDSWDPDW